MRAKRAIKYAEKEHRENLDRAGEVAELGKDLQTAYKQNKALDREGIKKLDRLEKLIKKLRSEAGGEDDEVNIDHPPTDLSSAMVRLTEVSDSLCEKVRKTPRQVVSAAVIDEANVLLEVIRLVRSMAR